jgi:hypothetical protein
MEFEAQLGRPSYFRNLEIMRKSDLKNVLVPSTLKPIFGGVWPTIYRITNKISRSGP